MNESDSWRFISQARVSRASASPLRSNGRANFAGRAQTLGAGPTMIEGYRHLALAAG
jgi:hypothetical protein